MCCRKSGVIVCMLRSQRLAYRMCDITVEPRRLSLQLLTGGSNAPDCVRVHFASLGNLFQACLIYQAAKPVISVVTAYAQTLSTIFRSSRGPRLEVSGSAALFEISTACINMDRRSELRRGMHVSNGSQCIIKHLGSDKTNAGSRITASP